MSLPTIEPLPDENETLPPARRRRQRRMLVPPGSSERAELLSELAYRTEPSFDFFLFSLLAGLTLALGLLLDSPALVFLGVLLAPFLAPAVGMAVGTISGSARFVVQSLGSLGVGSLIVFLAGLLAGWAVRLLPAPSYQQALDHSHFTWPDFLVLLVGAGLTTYLTLHAQNQRFKVIGAALAYALFIPVCVAGFGLSSGIAGLWPGGLWLFLLHLAWAVLASTLVFGLLGLRPLSRGGYLAGALYAGVGIAAVLLFYQPQSALPAALAGGSAGAPQGVVAGQETQPPQATPSPSPLAATETATLTPTARPSATPSQPPTLTPTAAPTAAWARVSAPSGNGALIREAPNFDAPVVQSLLNGTLVEVLPDLASAGLVHWVHIRLPNGKEGWVVLDLLRTTTPEPAP